MQHNSESESTVCTCFMHNRPRHPFNLLYVFTRQTIMCIVCEYFSTHPKNETYVMAFFVNSFNSESVLIWNVNNRLTPCTCVCRKKKSTEKWMRVLSTRCRVRVCMSICWNGGCAKVSCSKLNVNAQMIRFGRIDMLFLNSFQFQFNLFAIFLMFSTISSFLFPLVINLIDFSLKKSFSPFLILFDLIDFIFHHWPLTSNQKLIIDFFSNKIKQKKNAVRWGSTQFLFSFQRINQRFKLERKKIL